MPGEGVSIVRGEAWLHGWRDRSDPARRGQLRAPRRLPHVRDPAQPGHLDRPDIDDDIENHDLATGEYGTQE